MSFWDSRVVPLAATLAVLFAAVAGHATPSDTLWVDGVYDGADLDDLLASFASSDGLPVDLSTAAHCAPSPGAACQLRPVRPSRAPVHVSPAPRAPPGA